MDGSNLLSGGIDTLNEIKENLLELHGYQGKYEELLSEEEKLEKSIHSIEKAAADEISSTTKKRRQEIEDTFDDQIDKTRTRIKKIRDKRDKRKDKKVSERISEETAPLRDESNRLKLEAKTIIKQSHAPSFCNSKVFYALYLPKFLEDILIILSTLVLTLFIIPCGIYFFILPEERILYLILIYIGTVIIFGGIYLLIGHLVKDRHRDALMQARVLKFELKNNKKKIKKMSRSIKKDRDESRYGLENFDEELARLSDEEAEITKQKKDALLTFDNTTSQVIASEISGRYEEKLAKVRSEYDRAGKEAADAEAKIKALTIKIASEYEPFIGKDLITPDRVDSLINIIQAGNAATISEAVTFYRQNTN